MKVTKINPVVEENIREAGRVELKRMLRIINVVIRSRYDAKDYGSMMERLKMERKLVISLLYAAD